MKWFEALVLVIYMTHNALLPGQVTHRSHLLFPKTRLCPLSMGMAIMAKLVFWPILALYHSQIDPRIGPAAFVGLSSCDIHEKQCTASMSTHSWELFTLPKNQTLSSYCRNKSNRVRTIDAFLCVLVLVILSSLIVLYNYYLNIV